MKRRDLGPDPHGHVEQANGVATAGEEDQQRLAGPDQAAFARGFEWSVAHRCLGVGTAQLVRLVEALQLHLPDRLEPEVVESRTASNTESVSSTSPPRARATTREARFTSRPK